MRAVGRALAALHARLDPPGGPAGPEGHRVGGLHGRLDCRRVWVRGGRAVRFAEPGPAACGDLAQDVADLALDLRARGAGRRAEQLLAAYALAADDYGIYRAQTLPDDCMQPVVIATGGSVASGKSTLATALARRLAIPRVVADRVREALTAPHEVGWTPEFAAGVYAGLFERAAAVLASGRSVVLDACFPRAAHRREAASLAERHGAHFVFLHCDPPRDVIAARLRRRDRRDGGGWQALARTAEFEPLRAEEPGRHLRVDTDRSGSRALRALARAIRAPA